MEEWAATCELCEWSRTMKDQSDARIVSVLHVLTKHPLRYKLVTGKDPDEAKQQYATQLAFFRKDL